MLHLLTVLFFAAVIVEARNEMIIHGWVDEPDGRGTWSILWTCLTTIFICTWSALHLNVPEEHSTWLLYDRKIVWMLLAVIAPEVLLHDAMYAYLGARSLRKDLLLHGGEEWTLTHTQFVYAQGFYTRASHKEAPSSKLLDLVRSGRVTGPPISEDELSSRGKSDVVVKMIAILQITWFGLQTLVRAIQHYQITPLEILTTAFIFCSLFIYRLYWNKTQGVDYPTLVHVRGATPVSKDAEVQASSASRIIESSKTNQDNWDWAEIFFFLSACAFGVIHCLAWTSSFPTPAERLAWRICSLAMTALPILMLMFVPLSRTPGIILSERTIDYVLRALFTYYAIGRITIIVLSLMALRALPANAFQTVDWNNYLPHFAA
ncbi:hypothetical protein MMC14_001989 [Varicellaria rhodocarpa]|nr:hypothetical protein [Varicellaria rhodocarpa]